MGTELATAGGGGAELAGPRRALDDRADQLDRASRAASTWRAYDADVRLFAAWCAERGEVALPASPETVRRWLADVEDRYKPSTIGRKLAAVSVAHQAAGLTSPTGHPRVRSAWSGIRRTKGVAPEQAHALVRDDVAALVAPLDRDRPGDVRDRAAVLLGFAAALRRSELVALDLADVAATRDGLLVTVRKSKRDQEGAGETVGVPYGAHPATCPVRAWQDWTALLADAGHTTGPAFRPVDRHGRLGAGRLSDRAVASMLARRAAAAGVDGRVSGHSLRAGFATTAARAGVPDRAIMRQGRWSSRSSMDGYVRAGTVWDDNAAARLGL